MAMALAATECGDPEAAPHVPVEWLRRRRPRSLGLDPLRKRELKEAERIDGDEDLLRALAARPRDRSECRGRQRPCPYAGCSMHLALEITPNGAPRILFPDGEGGIDFAAMEDTCALDVADRGPITVEHVGRLLRLTYERIRQMQRAMERRFKLAWAADAPEQRALFVAGRPKPAPRRTDRKRSG